MKTKSIRLNEKDIKLFSKIKSFLGGGRANISQKDVSNFVHTVNWMIKIFNKKENNEQFTNDYCCIEKEKREEEHDISNKIREVVYQDGLLLYKNKIVTIHQVVMSLILGKRVAINGKEIIKPENFNGIMDSEIKEIKLESQIKKILNQIDSEKENGPKDDKSCTQSTNDRNECWKSENPDNKILNILYQDDQLLYKNCKVSTQEIADALLYGKRIAINNVEIKLPTDTGCAIYPEDADEIVREQIDKIKPIHAVEYNDEKQKKMFIRYVSDFVSHVLNDKFDPTNDKNNWETLSSSIQEVIKKINELNKK